MANKRFHRRHKIVAPCRTLAGEGLESRHVLDGLPLITEFLAVNDRTLTDRYGEFSDWIEIYNPSDESASLDGWYLTDDGRNLPKWRLPAVSLAGGDYLIIFASGKDQRDPQSELHTNFKLSGDGEFLALIEPDRVTIRQQFSSYPEQTADISFGPDAELERELYFPVPTPGAQNGVGWLGTASAPQFSVERGFYTAAFDVTLTNNMPDTEIRYTLDGSPPSLTNGFRYADPISIHATTILRAATFKSDYLPSTTMTQSYLFLADVLTQTQPEGYPNLIAGDYNVWPGVVATHRDTILDDLRAVPSLSLVMKVDDMFGPQGTNNLGEDRPTSVEMMYPDGREGFQIDAGVRQQGGATRAPNVPKHAFRLRFTSDYGPSKLEFPLFSDSQVTTFDTLVLRAGLQDAWQRGPAGQNQYIKDEFARRTQLAMQRPAAHGTWVHLYINGLYWGLYNLVERPDASFAAAHLGGSKEDWDALNAGNLRDGDTKAWDQMLALTPRGAPDLPSFDTAKVALNYQAIQEFLDIPGFIDYLLIGTYMGTQDWLPNNYYVARRSRVDEAPIGPEDPTGKFFFFHWDQESSLLAADVLKNFPGFISPVGRVFQLLRRSPEFQETNAQQIYDRLYNGGALSPETVIERYQGLVSEVQDAIKGEAIRWGADTSNIADWQEETHHLIQNYFPQRRDIIVDQYRRFGLYPSADAPVFSRQGGLIYADEPLSMSVSQGQIYYTLDGSDPRLPDGSVAPTARQYTSPILLSHDTVVRARTVAADEWSVVNRADFTLRPLPRTGDFDSNGIVEAIDIALLCQQVSSMAPKTEFDLTGDGKVNRQDHDYLVREILQTQAGDTNLDGVFDSTDLLLALQSNAYEQANGATWESGDWNCDGTFSTQDLVWAFQQGGYRK